MTEDPDAVAPHLWPTSDPARDPESDPAHDPTPDAATQAQHRAADPGVSTWLSANAGSGKTRVLTDRVARLLLAGTEPQNILCLTFTKAAASEMQNRLFGSLGAWAMMDDTALSLALRKLGEAGRPDLARARTLFARAIETPGGLRIQTIHAFCASVLRRFPLEAGVSPAFVEMEDMEAARLRTAIVDAMADSPDERIVALVDALASHLSGDALDPLLNALCQDAAAFDPAPTEAELRRDLDLAPDETADDLLASVLAPGDRALIEDLIPILQAKGGTDGKAAIKLAELPDDPGLADLEHLETVFLFGERTKAPFTAKIGSFPTKPVRHAHPDLCAGLDDLMQRVEDARPRRQSHLALARSLALARFAAHFLPAFEAAKADRAMLGFDDLIKRTVGLLTTPGVAEWVLWRLDGGIDHILVDEAQDTAPSQWDVIAALAAEITSGQGARPDSHRTLFVVGDKKQSIYSFQGADADGFDRWRDRFRADLAPSAPGLAMRELSHSFRSSAAILRVVDETFVGPMREGLGAPQPHVAFHADMPGRVDLWPPVEKPPKTELEADWRDPTDRPAPRDPQLLLAEHIAAWLKRQIDAGTPIPRRNPATGVFEAKPLTEGDVLILVRGRKRPLFSALIRQMKAQGLAVAGADRLRIGAELAVQDITATLRFLALPEDDLSLAAALRSPLFGWSERDLFRLSRNRPKKRLLWQVLRDRRHAHPDTMVILDDLRRQADFLRPYDLIARLLLRHDGRCNLIARLGPEAEDGIDALLSQALAFERAAVPDLTGFLDWLDAEEIEIKRTVDSASGRIRVMTVHGAKGLEAPLVILPDTTKRPPPARGPIQPGPPAHWAMPRPQMPPSQSTRHTAATAAERAENRRLLYVAMTRAESWLIVAAAGDTGDPGDSWHATIAAGMEHGGAFELDTPTGPGTRVSHGDWDAMPAADASPASPRPGRHIGPFAAVTATDPTGTPPRPLAPSDLGGAKILPGDVSPADRETALAEGRALHLLLERLPAVPEAERSAHAPAMIAAMGEVLPPGRAAALARAALRLVADPALAAVFAPETMAEVGLTATLPDLGGARLSGSIDRLIVTDDKIVAIDFKTNRLAPSRPDQVPDGLLRQMGAYRGMLAQLWPGRRIEVALLWTATAQLMPLPDWLLDEALARVTPP